MARRPNYGFEKRQKELERQKKKEAKAEKKQARKEEAAHDGETTSQASQEWPGSEAESGGDSRD